MKTLTAISMLFLTACVSRSTAAPKTQTPSAKCAPSEYRQFDFWLGDWDAFESEDPKKPIARTHVDRLAGACGVREVYEQIDGLIGESFNVYDASRKVWNHTWVSNFGQLMVLEGAFKDGKMTLDGISHHADGSSKKIHNVWSVEPDGGIREAAQVSLDDGKTWKVFFDVVFRKHK
jgi:hypothetical protein